MEFPSGGGLPKIAFFIARHSRSGVPLAQMRLAKAFHRQGFAVDFVVGYVPEGIAPPSAEGIRVIVLGRSRAAAMFMPICRYLRAERPGVVFSAEDHLNFVVTAAMLVMRSKAKLSVSSRVTPFDTYSNRIFTKRWFLKQIATPMGRRADALVCVSKDMIAQYVSIFGPRPFQCIYNVICDEDSARKMLEPVTDEPWLQGSEVPVVISAGRLAPEKGFPDLIKAVRIANETRPVRLLILGEGPMAAELEQLIHDEGVRDAVKLIGFRSNPHQYLKRSAVFVLSSYVEGLPNVLVEAMECGCTPVATDCPTGPREVLKGGEYGQLVPVHDPAAMAAAILQALDQPLSPERLKEAVQPFTERQVIQKHRASLGI
jgi:glycosyltransferase involved in cell wall biosynthesis